MSGTPCGLLMTCLRYRSCKIVKLEAVTAVGNLYMQCKKCNVPKEKNAGFNIISTFFKEIPFCISKTFQKESMVTLSMQALEKQ